MIGDVRGNWRGRSLDQLLGGSSGPLGWLIDRPAGRASPHRPAHRSHRTLALAAIVGVLTGGAVTVFDWLAAHGLDTVLGWPVALQAAAPLLGLALAALALRYLAGGATPMTSDEYIRNYHEPGRPLPLRAVPGRVVASLATLGLGGAMGYEGISVYMGSAHRVGRSSAGSGAGSRPTTPSS